MKRGIVETFGVPEVSDVEKWDDEKLLREYKRWTCHWENIHNMQSPVDGSYVSPMVGHAYETEDAIQVIRAEFFARGLVVIETVYAHYAETKTEADHGKQ